MAHGAPVQVCDVEIPAPGADEVYVEMAFGGVNPVDRYIAQGMVAHDAPLPRTLGVEGVGRVDGRWVALYGHGFATARDGLWAQGALAPTAALVEVPDGVAPPAAAAVGVAGATAYKTVHELARVGTHDRVLVLGASGGVGSMIVSLARATGAEVWGQTGHEDKAALVAAQGATRVVVVEAPADLAGSVADLAPTVVFDPLGGGFTGCAVEALCPYGRLVVLGTSAAARGEVPLQGLYRKSLRVLGYGGLIESDAGIRAGVEGALAALRDGSLTVPVADVLPFSAIDDAFARLADRLVAGKLLLALGD